MDRLFFVGLQEEMVVSGLLLLRKMDRAEKLLQGKRIREDDQSLDCEELRQEVLNLPRERSTSSITTIPHTIYAGTNSQQHKSIEYVNSSTSLSGRRKSGNLLLVNNHSVKARMELERDPTVVQNIIHNNQYDVILYEYGEM